MLDGSFILATSAIHLITVVLSDLLGLTQVKVTLNSLILPSEYKKWEGEFVCYNWYTMNAKHN